MSGETTKGREYAIEALMDMDPRGQSFRVSKIMNEIPSTALACRPNLITNAALLDVIGDQQKCIISGRDNAIGKVSDMMKNENKDDLQHKATKRERIMRYQAKIVMAKNNGAKPSERPSDKNRHDIDTSGSPTASTRAEETPTIGESTTIQGVTPPPQLVASLRKIYGAQSPERNLTPLHDEQDQRASVKAGSLLLPSLLRSVLNHPVFSPTKGVTVSCNVRERGETTDGPVLKRKNNIFPILHADVENERKLDQQSSCGSLEKDTIYQNNMSSIGNIETIVGNACVNHHLNITKLDGKHESIQGFLIAALSVLSSCVIEEDVKSEAKSNEKINSRTGVRTGISPTPVTKWNQTPLQVASALSLESNSFRDTLLDSLEESALILDKDVLEYFGEASSVYEERIEIQKSLLMTRITKKSKISKNQNEEPNDNTSGENVLPSDCSNNDSSYVNSIPNLLPSTSIRSNSVDSGIDQKTPPVEKPVPHTPASPMTHLNFDPNSDSELPPLRHNFSMESHDEVESSDSGEDNDDDDDSETTAGYVDGRSHHALFESHGSFDGDNHDSSSSSSSDRKVDDSEDEVSDVDIGEVESNDEEDDEATMLQQALAMSLAEHEAAISAQSKADRAEDDKNKQSQSQKLSVTTKKDVAHIDLPNTTFPTTPSKPSTVIEMRTGSGLLTGNDSKKDENKLPQLPRPPLNRPYEALLSRCNVIQNSNESKSSHIDPSSFAHFGSLPSAPVLVQLLRSAIAVVDKDTQQSFATGNTKHNGPVCPFVGGVGCALFPLESSVCNENVESELRRVLNSISPCILSDGINNQNKECLEPKSVVVHMLVAILYLLSNLRSEAISNLHDLLVRDIKKNESLLSNLSINADTDYIEETDETDDPAFAVITSGSIPCPPSKTISRSSMEELEEKGMVRKAAAAAHVESLKQENKKNTIDSLQQNIALYSLCSYLTMKCFRLFLQKLTSDSLSTPSMSRNLTHTDHIVSLSPLTRVRLLTSLSSFSSPASSKVCHSLLTITDCPSSKVISHQDFLTSALFKESTSLWGESVPLIYSTKLELEDQLERLIKHCFPSAFTSSHKSSNVFDLSTFNVNKSASTLPWSDEDEQSLKLDAMCLRLRFRDMLEVFVSRPKKCDIHPEDKLSCLRTDDKSKISDPTSVLAILSNVVFNSPSKFVEPNEGNLFKFLKALCHRSSSSLLLWDDQTLISSDYSMEHTEHISYSSISSDQRSKDTITNVVPNPTYNFDPTKCSDSIAISSSVDGPCANQRASKVWGTVLSMKHFNPKSGIHRWALRIDKCERGHVFFGVATSQASTKTYVGGDKHGWGVIGTQALWHNRSKIRGDYGSVFRTGATIVVTLDTDAGTLSFGLWKQGHDDQNSSTQTMNLSSPCRNATSSLHENTFEDWGIAFEGLPLDTRLFPAVGLYQRDDKVTILSIETNNDSGDLRGKLNGSLGAGERYYPRTHFSLLPGSVIESIKQWNFSSCVQGIAYASQILNQVIHMFSDHNLNLEKFFAIFDNILKSVVSSLCLYPSTIPILSGMTAMKLLPLIEKCILLIEGRIEVNSSLLPIKNMKEGSWVIRATPSSGNSGNTLNKKIEQFEEYEVQLGLSQSAEFGNNVFYGNGIGTTGKSANGHVTIFGNVRGSSIQFVEEWTDGDNTSKNSLSSSSCIIDGRLSLDGLRFEGIYKNVQYGTTGVIAGMFDNNSSVKGAPDENSFRLKEKNTIQNRKLDFQQRLICLSSLFCMASCHMSLILSTGAPMKDVSMNPSFDAKIPQERKNDLNQLVSLSPVLTGGFTDTDHTCTESVHKVQKLFNNLKEDCEIVSKWNKDVIQSISGSDKDTSHQDHSLEINAKLLKLDVIMAPRAAGYGSLSCLDRKSYQDARIKVISVLLNHFNLYRIALTATENSFEVIEMWRHALHIMESTVRASLSDLNVGESRKEKCIETCNLIASISDFLLLINYSCESDKQMKMKNIKKLYSFISSLDDLTYIHKIMNISTQQSILRYISLKSSLRILSGGVHTKSAIECILATLPRLIWGNDMNQTYSSAASLNKEHHMNLSEKNCSSVVSGCTSMQNSMKSLIQQTYSMVESISSNMLKYYNNVVSGFRVSPAIESLTLTLLANFTIAFQKPHYASLIDQTILWKLIGKIFSCCRPFLEFSESVNIPRSINEISVITSLIQESSVKHSSLTILQSCCCVLHVALFKLSNNGGCKISKVTEPMLILKSEIIYALKKVGNDYSSNIVIKKMKGADADWKIYSEVHRTDKGKKQKLGNQLKKHDSASDKDRRHLGIIHMLNRGVIGNFSNPTITRQSISSTAEYLTTKLLVCEHYLLHLLNALGSVIHSHNLKALSSDLEWIDQVLGFAFFNYSKKNNCNCSPVRIRVRILRLMRFILPSIPAQTKLIKKLFISVGHGAKPIDPVSFLTEKSTVGMDNSYEYDQFLETKEAVALLRHLYIPVEKKDVNNSHTWRSVINSVMDSSKKTNIEDVMHEEMQIGILSFLGGTPGRITVGSHVLLKPSAATSIFSSSSLTSNKSTISSNGPGSSMKVTPPVVSAFGIEGVVAGLCRDDALAGMVSHIDLNGGVCEIILFDRTSAKNSKANDIGCNAEQETNHSMTVRAVRGSLSDIVSAEETPLILDSDIPLTTAIYHPLHESLGKTLSIIDRNPIPLHHDMISNLKTTILSLKASAVILSDKQLLMSSLTNMQSGLGSRCMSHLLALSSMKCVSDNLFYGNVACSESLSNLPEYEARYWHLCGMLSDISIRHESFNSVPDSQWLKEKCNIKKSANPKARNISTMKTEEAGQQNKVQGFSTPRPATQNISSSSSLLSLSERSDGSNQNLAGTHHSSIETATEEVEENKGTDEASRIAEETAAAHLREAAIVQMAELGLPRPWSQYALRRVGGTNIEAAVHFCLEHSGDMERLLIEEEEREQRVMPSLQFSGARRSNSSNERSSGTSHSLRQLVEMGFPPHWCAEALVATGNNVDEALTWILTNGERLSAIDEGNDEDDEEEVDDESLDCDEEALSTENVEESRERNTMKNETSDESKKEEDNSETYTGERHKLASREWPKDIICPLRPISGQSNIGSELEVTGLPNGGFSSVGTKGILLTTGKWYYEAVLLTAGCLQIGWADSSFAGHCQSDRGDGCGDGPSSWAYDGWRRYRWHSSPTEWGCRWQEGDVVGCSVDMDEKKISFHLNGQGEEIGMGLAFSGSGFRPCGGVYACVSFNRREKIQLVLGDEKSSCFHYPPPPGYKGVGEAVHSAVQEREILLKEENILASGMTTDCLENDPSFPKPYMCDFSDGEHGHELFAWQHRYYGSDASVHLGATGKNGAKSLSRGRREYRGTRGRGAPSSENSSDTSQVCNFSVTTRMIKHLATDKDIAENQDKTASENDNHVASILQQMKTSYHTVTSNIISELCDVSIALIILYSRKLLMHLTITLSTQFKLEYFSGKNDTDEIEIARQFWFVIERCCSLLSAGWVGEAGTMAVASEALGLGISSHENHSHGSSGAFSGIFNFSHGKKDNTLLPSGAITQFLSTVQSIVLPNKLTPLKDASLSLPACAETSLGGDGGGSIVFLRDALQSAVIESRPMRKLLIAVIRNSVRRLAVIAVVENGDENTSSFSVDDSVSEDENDTAGKGTQRVTTSQSNKCFPDARLISFLTGLLLSKTVHEGLSSAEGNNSHALVAIDLFEAWSVGLLSASVPWRMICANTASGILNLYPESLSKAMSRLPTLKSYFERLESTVARRVWTERASVPITSRYVQAMIELLCSVNKSQRVLSCDDNLKKSIAQISVDAATPIPLKVDIKYGQQPNEEVEDFWELDECWNCSDAVWEVWTGMVECHSVDWTTPSRSALRSLMDGGEGPPMLRAGCTVVRGLDWDEPGSGTLTGKEDGKDTYEKEKKSKEKEKCCTTDITNIESISCKSNSEETTNPEDRDLPVGNGITQVEDCETNTSNNEESNKDSSAKKKKRKTANPKLPIGTIVGIESWKGIPGGARRVRWHLTNEESLYRYGGDGGRYDIAHVEVNERHTRIKKRYPLPESAEQCAARYGFGMACKYNVLLRIKNSGKELFSENEEIEHLCDGILEWPDFGAGIQVTCTFHNDGAMTLIENRLLFGSKDSGWEARFGQPSFVTGTTIVVSPCISDGHSFNTLHYEELLGSSSYLVQHLRNRKDGSRLRVTSEMRLLRGRRKSLDSKNCLGNNTLPLPPPIQFDSDYHASSMTVSQDCRTVTCTSSEGRGTAFASAGFVKGVHYWEVKIEQADIGSIFIGVAEKPLSNSGAAGPSFVSDTQPRLNRWHGWGFVNFRATYNAGAERVYGAHCHAGDTIGVHLDCDAGRISYFFDGVKYGEHILNDLGCAFENISPFGFNADGCGSGGVGQGAPNTVDGGRGGRLPANGSVRPKALWPVIGLRHPGDRVTISGKWLTNYGVDGGTVLRNTLKVDEIFCCYESTEKTGTTTTISEENKVNIPISNKLSTTSTCKFPKWFIKESFEEYKRWWNGRWVHTKTRGSGPFPLASYGLDVYLDTSPKACAVVCALLGIEFVLLPGDKVSINRSSGRLLELPEEAIVLGAFQGRLWYRIISQKSEGGSLTEGGNRAWFWDESEVVHEGVKLISESAASKIKLPLLDCFCCCVDGLRVVYHSGAIVRSDLEIFDGSPSIGTIPNGTIIAKADVLERRVNSCGVIRYCIRYKPVGIGWISSRIRGGKEEVIVEPIKSLSSKSEDHNTCSVTAAIDHANIWYDEWKHIPLNKNSSKKVKSFAVETYDQFEKLFSEAIICGFSPLESDSLLISLVGSIADHTPSGDALNCSIHDLLPSLMFAIKSDGMSDLVDKSKSISDKMTNEAISAKLSNFSSSFPPIKSILCRIAMLRALNKRSKYALSWLSIRPPQEGSAILGGLAGFGTAVERAGRSRNTLAMDSWVQAPSVGTRLRAFRTLLFYSIKKEVLYSIVDATTTPTPLSHDEYELPREIRTVRVNRLKARRAMSSSHSVSNRKHSVFSQLKHEIGGWSGAWLRRGHVAKGHGGQKRAFKVKLIGEGVNDYSGPYREVFTDAMREVTTVDDKGVPALGILEPSSNKKVDIGEDRSLFVFASGSAEILLNTFMSNNIDRSSLSNEEMIVRNYYASYNGAASGDINEIEESLLFLGKLCGTASRHKIPIDISFPSGIIWKRLTEENVRLSETLNEIDVMAARQIKEDGGSLELDESLSPFLAHQQRMLNAFVEGMASVLPLEIFPIFSSAEICGFLCGNPDVDIDLLQQVVEYEGFEKDDLVITNFWESLREMSPYERKLFLQFVWARSRLPMKVSDFDAPFKIQKDSKTKVGDSNSALPSASTCFFTLTLPEYNDKGILKKKLLYAIRNVTTMESDYVTNDAEVGEGWKGL